jgi:small subunit ribosomal protein S4
MASIHDSMQKIKEGKQMPWLQLDKAAMRGTFLEVPNRADMPVTFNEHLVVELYSK